MSVKKRKILETADDQLAKARENADINIVDLANDDEFSKITNFCQNPRTAVRMLGKIIQTIPEMKGPRIDE
jgi:hypothetical protein